MGGRWGPSPEVAVKNLRFDFACTTTNIAAASASSAAFFTVADWNTYDGFFASATTCKAGSRSLAVAFRTQFFLWHCSLSRIFCATRRSRCHGTINSHLNWRPRQWMDM